MTLELIVDNFGRRLAELRKNRGLTQTQLAIKTGIGRANISHYELGKRQPDIDTLIRLADFFNVTVDYLFGREQEAV